MAPSSNKRFRIIILGAGFSRYAGLPLGLELWSSVLARARKTTFYESFLRPDLQRFIKYKAASGGVMLTEETIDFEEFMGFLDLEHFLGLRGSDTWTSTGNESQHVVRNLISLELHERQKAMNSDAWKPYLTFVDTLLPDDYILTFNYDTLVETALERVGKPYRLCPHLYSEVRETGATVDSARSDVIVLKLHGSIDWFDLGPIEGEIESAKASGLDPATRHPVFGDSELFTPEPITSGPRFPDDPLKKIFRVRDLDAYFERCRLNVESPLILAPSTAKLFYVNPLKEFWYGLQGAGSANFGLAIIGFSLPPHDDYLRQILYEVVDNYQSYDPGIPGLKKTPLRFVSRPASTDEATVLKERFRFIDWHRTEQFWDGFGPESVEKIMA